MTALPAGIGIVTGIAAEATLARRLTDRVVCSGGDPARAARQAQELIEAGATALLSFGIAGGLDPSLRPGTLIVADRVATGNGLYPTQSPWLEPLKARSVTVYGGVKIAHELSDKQYLFSSTSAIAIDLESGAVAQAATAAEVPFGVLRAVADPAWRTLPPAALLPLDAEGGPRLAAVFGSVVKNPGQIPGLIALALDTRAALRTLLRACRVLAL